MLVSITNVYKVKSYIQTKTDKIDFLRKMASNFEVKERR